MGFKVLEFTNPVFHDGINLTVRRGRKWAGVTEAHIGLGGVHSVRVTTHTKTAPFRELDAEHLIHEHDPACRTPDGLFDVLATVYPGFSRKDEVTLIHFILNFRPPVEGDSFYVPDMAPYCVGKVEEVIELNDNFYEIRSGNTRGVVHASQFDPHIATFYGPDDVEIVKSGWFVHTPY